MHDVIESILLYQTDWTAVNTPDMASRGQLIRQDGPDWFRDHLPQLTEASQVEDLSAEGRDGTGNKTKVPWFRLFSRLRSPSATIGWYVVMLFSASGSRAYMSLNQGTTTWTGGDFEPKPPEELARRVSWARSLLTAELASRQELAFSIDLESDRGLGEGYQRGNVAAFVYPVDSIPPANVLEEHALFLASLLGKVYRAEETTYVPGDPAPEVLAAIDAANEAAGRPRPRSGQGFRLTKAEQKAVEARAVALATEYYLLAKWNVRYVGTSNSYDLHIDRDGEERKVEVKGTTSLGAQVVLTRNEVETHRDGHPYNALVVVHSIALDRSVAPTASGGVLFEVSPWDIDDGDLKVISYTYRTPVAHNP